MEIKQLADKVEIVQKDITVMKDFLLGNEFNGKHGIAAVLDDHDKRLEVLEEHKAITKVYSDLMKWIFGMIVTALVALVIFFIQKYSKWKNYLQYCYCLLALQVAKF